MGPIRQGEKNLVRRHTSQLKGKRADTPPPGDPPPPPQPLAAPSDEHYWFECQCKGSDLLRAMRSSDSDAGQLFEPPRASAQSQWNSPDDLTTWGWNFYAIADGPITEFDGGYNYPEHGWGIGNALRELHVSDKATGRGGWNYVSVASHGNLDLLDDGVPYDDQRYLVNGRTYRVSWVLPSRLRSSSSNVLTIVAVNWSQVHILPKPKRWKCVQKLSASCMCLTNSFCSHHGHGQALTQPRGA